MNQTTVFEGAEQQEVSQPKAGPGAQLAAQREARSWTIEQVATQLNLAPRQIHALETDNFAALPGMASVRGFIRSYAKLLKIEAEPLLALIAVDAATVLHEPAPMRRALPTPFSEDTRLPTLGGHSAPSKLTLVVLLLILLAVGAFGAHQMGWIPALPESSSIKDEASMPASAAATGASVSETAVPEVPRAVVSDAPTTANSATNPVVTQSTSLTAIAKPAAEPLTVAPRAVIAPDTTAASGKNALVLKLREDSWVEVKRTNGNGPNSILISRLIKAGSTETVEIAEPVSVTIGNAAGVDMSLRGTPVDLKADMKSNVARLNLK